MVFTVPYYPDSHSFPLPIYSLFRDHLYERPFTGGMVDGLLEVSLYFNDNGTVFFSESNEKHLHNLMLLLLFPPLELRPGYNRI
jgi:hypothetical protein